jgi:hypothetical protein
LWQSFNSLVLSFWTLAIRLHAVEPLGPLVNWGVSLEVICLVVKKLLGRQFLDFGRIELRLLFFWSLFTTVFYVLYFSLVRLCPYLNLLLALGCTPIRRLVSIPRRIAYSSRNDVPIVLTPVNMVSQAETVI